MMVWSEADQARENERFAQLSIAQGNERFNRPDPPPPDPLRLNPARPSSPLDPNDPFVAESRLSAGEGPGVPIGSVWTGTELIPPPPPPPPTPPPGGGGTDWAALFEQQRQAAERARQNLEREFMSRRDELRAQYQFAETEQEKAQLAFLMAELDKATQRADQAIVSGYAYAVESIGNLQASGRLSTDQETQAIQNIFLAAGSQYGDMAADVAQRVGLQGGLAGNAYEPARDFFDMLIADQAREAVLAQRMGGVVDREMTDAERRMAFQQASQQADLQRQSAASGAQTRADQQAAVAARIARERLDWTNQLRQLQTTYATLGASFDMAGIDSFGKEAEGALAESMLRQQLAAQERMSSAGIAARLQEMEKQWAREDAARPDWMTPELAMAMFQWESLPQLEQNQEAWNRILGPFFGTGADVPGRPGTSGVPPEVQDPRPAPRPQPPLVQIPDADLQAELDRRNSRQFETEARAYYNAQILQLQNVYRPGRQGPIPEATVREIALRNTQRLYPGWQP